MNSILERFRDKNILIWGYGREGKSTEDFFRRHPVAASVDISEGKPGEVDFSGYDYVFKSPGIRLEFPIIEDFNKLAHGKDPAIVNTASLLLTRRLTSQTDLFIEAFRDRVIGITGTKGKSTTTSLMHHVLKACLEAKTNASGDLSSAAGASGTAGLRTAYLVGNIGVPCLDYFDEMAEGDAIAVFELSCHQLAYATVSPHWSIFLNLYEDHLDFYGDRETYFQAKRHITEFQTSVDFLYLGTDVPALETEAQIVTVTERYEDDAMHLLGEHNRYNAAFVDRLAREHFGLDAAAVRAAIEDFPGLPHRLQYVATVNDVRYYDDSISTIPEATIQAVESIPGVATVLVGGMDREIDYTPLIRFIPEHPEVQFVCMYASGERIFHEVETQKNVCYVPDLATAVDKAKAITAAGKACVLSPAAASYGYFKNFEERGDKFKELLQ